MQPQRSLRISAYSLSGAGAKPVINTSRSPGHPAPRAGGHQRFAALVRRVPVSLVVVVLVGIGFTRLTMLALELRDNFDEDEPLDVGRKRVDCHNRMRAMSKPATLVFRNDNQFETEGVPRFEPGLVTRTINSILCPRDDADKDDDVDDAILFRDTIRKNRSGRHDESRPKIVEIVVILTILSRSKFCC